VEIVRAAGVGFGRSSGEAEEVCIEPIVRIERRACGEGMRRKVGGEGY
jgi:hypothetical protein